MTPSLLLVVVLRAMRTSRHNRAGREVTVGRSMNERKGRWATTYSRSGRIARPGAAGAKKKLRDWRRLFLRRPFGLPTSQGRGGLGCMDSTPPPGHLGPFEADGGRAAQRRRATGAGGGWTMP